MPGTRGSLAWSLIAPLMLSASPVLAQGMGGGGGFGGNGFDGGGPGGNGAQGAAGNGSGNGAGGRGGRTSNDSNGNIRFSGNADLMAWLAGIGMPDHGEIDEPVTGFANEALWEEERPAVRLARR